MSKYQLLCSCVSCSKETTAQSLSAHYAKCTSAPKNSCMHCGTLTNNNKFCSNSCKATYINSRRERKQKTRNPTKTELTYQKFLRGECSDRPTLRKYIAALRQYCCAVCSVSDWNNQPITLIVDHVDGNAGNNHPDNLQLLCPNCNSQTPTFGGRNKGDGRKARGLKLN